MSQHVTLVCITKDLKAFSVCLIFKRTVY